jgi:hypothetical protein
MNFQYPKLGARAVQRPVAFPQRPVRHRVDLFDPRGPEAAILSARASRGIFEKFCARDRAAAPQSQAVSIFCFRPCLTIRSLKASIPSFCTLVSRSSASWRSARQLSGFSWTTMPLAPAGRFGAGANNGAHRRGARCRAGHRPRPSQPRKGPSCSCARRRCKAMRGRSTA